MYIYLTTNLINKKIYIGKRELNWEDSINYLGSGKYLNHAIKFYGKENFKKELICFCNSRNELNKMEIFFINWYDSTNPKIGYNIHKGGSGGDTISNYKYSNPEKYQEFCNKARDNHIGISTGTHSLKWNKNISLGNSGKKRSEETKELIGYNSRNRSEETLNKMRKPKSNTDNMGKYNRTDEIKDKIRNSLIGKTQSEYTKKLRILSRRLYYATKRNDLIEILKTEMEIKSLKNE